MHKKTINNVRLGLFVLIGTIFLIAALYLIGNNRNIFDQTFTVRATFYKVNGLMKGNNVRFSGIDVGTVKSVRIASDTSVEVSMIIESDAKRFIRKNAIASVGTDGLIGNKLVEIDNPDKRAPSVEEGDMIVTEKPIETDQMMRILDRTNNDLAEITTQLKGITWKLNNSHALWDILSDTTMSRNVSQSIALIKTTTANAASFTKEIDGMLKDMRKGKGIVNYLFYDTTARERLEKSLRQVDMASNDASHVANELKQLTGKIKNGESTAGIVLSDSVFARDLNESMRNIKSGSVALNENMEALKHSFLLRGYFKKQEKKERKAKEDEARKK